MVPFCEFFNRHIADVLYDFAFKADNPYKSEGSSYPSPDNYRTEEQWSMVSSSEDSYEHRVRRTELVRLHRNQHAQDQLVLED